MWWRRGDTPRPLSALWSLRDSWHIKGNCISLLALVLPLPPPDKDHYDERSYLYCLLWMSADRICVLHHSFKCKCSFYKLCWGIKCAKQRKQEVEQWRLIHHWAVPSSLSMSVSRGNWKSLKNSKGSLGTKRCFSNWTVRGVIYFHIKRWTEEGTWQLDKVVYELWWRAQSLG